MPSIRLLSIGLVLSLSSLHTHAFKIYGVVVDQHKVPLPFANVYVKGTTNGTSTNARGQYFLDVEKGAYTVVVRSLGYKTAEKTIRVSNDHVPLNIVLTKAILTLPELVVTPNGEDPAYPIIRNVIARRKYLRDEIAAYQCDVYMKGLQTVSQKPKSFFGLKVPIDSGIVYLSESVSILSFMKPDKYSEEMISSKISGNKNGFSFNQVSAMMVNFYDNLIRQKELSQRSYVSPIAGNALFFYDYKLLGTYPFQEYKIHKIRVTPKRSQDPAFEGDVYIVDNQWRIHALDLLLTKSRGLEYIDSLRIRHTYAPVGPVWALLSQEYTFDLKAFKFRGKGTFLSVHSNYKIQPSTKVLMTLERNLEKEKLQNQGLMLEGRLFPKPKKEFKSERLKVDEKANKRDEVYWKRVRPIPLTSQEREDYRIKDSVQIIMKSKPYQDSIDQKKNKPSIGNFLVSGYFHSNSHENKYWRIEPIPSIIQFNTVEGLLTELKFTYSKAREGIVHHQIIPSVRYGLESQSLYAKLKGIYQLNQKKEQRLHVSAGKYVYQYNANEPIKPLVNTVHSLLIGDNYLKIYEKTFVEAIYQQEITHGLLAKISWESGTRRSLRNNSEYSFTDQGYSSNLPESIELADSSQLPRNYHLLQLGLDIKFKEQYLNMPDRKIVLGSRYPKLDLRMSMVLVI